MLNVSELTSHDELEALETEWSDLARRSPRATPFQHPGWLLPWWRHFGSGELFVLAVRNGGRLHALLPLFLHGWDGRRQLTLLGTGISDYLDVLTDSETATDSVRAIFAYVNEHKTRWDVCSWQDLPACSPLLCSSTAELAVMRTDAQPCVALTLPASADDFRKSLPHGLQRNSRRYTERLTSLGQVRFETLFDDDGGRAMSDLFELHAGRWTDRGQEGVLQDVAVQSFHRDAARAMAEAGALRVFRVMLDERPIAIVYGYVWHNVFYSYLGGFASDLKAISPGTVILAYGMQQAIEEGIRVWDFLRGDEAYKFTWGGRIVAKNNLLIDAGAHA